MITGACQGTRYHEGKTLGPGKHGVVGETLGAYIFQNRQLQLRGLQILPHHEDIAACRAQFVHRGGEFRKGFAQADEQAGLCGNACFLLCLGKGFQGDVHGCARVPYVLQAPYGFYVVGKHVRPGCEQGIQLGVPEIGDEHFNLYAGIVVLDGADASRKVSCAAIGQVIAVDAGYDGIAKPEFPDGHGQLPGFVFVYRAPVPGRGYGAETASARAYIAEHHKGGRAAAPALRLVRAGCFIAYRVEAAPGDKLAHGFPAGALRKAYFEPDRFSKHGILSKARQEAVVLMRSTSRWMVSARSADSILFNIAMRKKAASTTV